MDTVSIIGLDLAKQVFQVHGSDIGGETLFNRKLQRADVKAFFEEIPPCTVGMEACGSSYYWAREIEALGHTVKIMHPSYVKPFVKRGKTDAIDAQAISEAVMQKNMRFVPSKTAEQQAAAIVFKTRGLLVRQRTKSINALRGHMSEFGIVAGPSVTRARALAARVNDGDYEIPPSARLALTVISDQIEMLTARIEELDKEISSLAKQDDTVRRLTTIPGVGNMTAAAIKAYVPDPASFKSSRHFAAWIGLTPKAHSSGGKTRAGGISKMGNGLLRSLLFIGASVVLREARKSEDASSWIKKLRERRPFKVAAIAVANKMARTIWAILKKGDIYREPSKTTAAFA